jgi:general secretion pathway protein A
MYEQFYGMTERPFDLAANPRYLLLTPRHREALSNLEYGIAMRNGVTVLTGEAGTGKTTLLRAAMKTTAASAPGNGVPRFAYLSNPRFARDEFIEYLAVQFRLSCEAGRSKARFLIELESVLIDDLRNGVPNGLVVDEVQSMSLELLEEIRLLANLECEAQRLLPVLLVGQTEFDDRLNERSLRQLKQRIALRCALEPLTARETAAYIATRITLAGGNPGALFSREAVLAIHTRAKGIPRTISVLCDNALLTGFAMERRQIGADVIAEVGADFDLWPSQRRSGSLGSARHAAGVSAGGEHVGPKR